MWFKNIVTSLGFYTFVIKFNGMETIVITIKGKAKAKKILDVVKVLNGVTNATMATREELENISMLKACKAARKTEKVSKTDVFSLTV